MHPSEKDKGCVSLELGSIPTLGESRIHNVPTLSIPVHLGTPTLSSPSTSINIIVDNQGYETQERRPDEWVEAKDTIGTRFLWFAAILQIISAGTGLTFLLSAHSDQMSWNMGCWGVWTERGDTTGLDWIQFDSDIGWRFYSKDGETGALEDISRYAWAMGNLVSFVHTLVLIVSFGFLIFICATLRSISGRGKRVTEVGEVGSQTGISNFTNHLKLAKVSHRWVSLMGKWMVITGTFCLVVGCIGFYLAISWDFTNEMEVRQTGIKFYL
ncbi:unnamed protein product [Choristocarpus tenellus]